MSNNEEFLNNFEILQQQAATEAEAINVRIIRAQLLAETDWTQGKDIPESVSGPWAEYRQALRDIPEQEGFPFVVEYPQKPE